MNKRLLGGLLAAGIIGGGVYGFAATLDVTSGNLSAGDQLVASCDADGVDVDYTTAWDVADEQYEVASIVVRGIDADCDGDTIQVSLTDVDNAQIGEVDSDTVASTSMTFTDIADDDVSAEAVRTVHVAIAGDDS